MQKLIDEENSPRPAPRDLASFDYDVYHTFDEVGSQAKSRGVATKFKKGGLRLQKPLKAWHISITMQHLFFSFQKTKSNGGGMAQCPSSHIRYWLNHISCDVAKLPKNFATLKYLKFCAKMAAGIRTKKNLHYTCRITPLRVTSCGARLRGLARGQHSSEKTSQRWRVVGDTM